MYIRPRHVARACIVAGLAFAALPLTPAAQGIRGTGRAAAEPINGLTPALIKQAAQHPINVIMVLRQGNGAKVLHDLQTTGATRIVALNIVHGVAARVTAETLKSLEGNPDLAAITLDHSYKIYPSPDTAMVNQHLAQSGIRTATKVPAGQTLVSEPDTLSLTQADQVHKQFTGKGVRVAVLDSGIDLGQPDLKGVMAKGADGKPLYADFSGTDLTDTVGHGTACAGTIAGQAATVYVANDTYRALVYPPAKPGERFDNKTYFTYGGVAPGVKLMVGKILDARAPFSFTTDSNLVRAIGWAVANHADVISESWGTNFPFVTDGVDIVALADEAAVHAGVTVVAADGNSGPGQGTVGSPATAPDVIAAGASTDLRQDAETGLFTPYEKYSSDNIAYFTSEGPTSDGRSRPDVYAPGEDGWALFPRNHAQDSPAAPPYTVGSFGGTSMATPVIAGVAALVINAYESTHQGKRPTPAYVKRVILSSADNLGLPAADQAAGRVNALRAVQTVLHQGPSVLLSGPVALAGEPGTKPRQSITVTNSGSTPERITFQNPVAHQTKALTFKGTVVADNLYPYKFSVPAGVNKLSISLNFNSQTAVPLPSPQKASKLSLRVVLYDPQGNMANYGYTSQAGSGYTVTIVAHPVPGRWTAVVSEVRAIDKQQVRHYSNAGFTGHISMARFFSQAAMVKPSQVTLRPGQTTHVTFTSPVLTTPGVSEITLQAREHSLAAPAAGDAPSPDRTATIPVVLTTAIPFKSGVGVFGGTFTGGVGDEGFATETKYFTFVTPRNVHTLQMSLVWKHPGNWFWVSLIDPNGKIINLEDNALLNPGDLSAAPDLSQRFIDSYQINPLPGVWRITVLNFVPAGLYASEPFRGAVVLDQPFAQLSTSKVTAQAGGRAKPFSLKVANTGLGPQGYLTYATTDQYQYISLGGTGGVLQDGPLGATSTQVLTYTTGFVPPGTRKLVTQAQVLNGNTPVDVQMDDPIVDTYQSFGLPAPVAISGKPGQGTVAAVQDRTLPSGNWEVQLSVPGYKDTKPLAIAAATQGYSLAPQPWITMDAQFGKNVTIGNNGFYQGTLASALPEKVTTLHGTVKVPDGIAPGTYHAHIFVLTSVFDQLADLPLTITVTAPSPAAFPTPDPLLSTIASTQYFPEGATGQGLTDNMDLVNPGNVDAHAQVRLLTDNGWTSLTRYNLPAHSRKTVNLQSLVGDDQSIATLVQADQPLASGRAITRVNASGSYSVGSDATARRWYFADGYTVGDFQEYLTFVNPGVTAAHVRIHLVSDQGTTAEGGTTIGPASRTTIRVGDLLAEKAVSAAVTSDVPVVAERTQIFASGREGLTTAVGATATHTSGYIDPGHLPAKAQAHLTLFNPSKAAAHVHLSLLDTRGAVAATRTVTLAAGRRATVDLTATFGTANLGLLYSSDTGIVAEKVAYFGQFRKSQVGGSNLFAIASPSTDQIFPGGSTVGKATDTLGIYNPASTAAKAAITVLYGAGKSTQRTVDIPAHSRVSVKVGDFGVPSGSSSVLVDGVDGAQLYATQTLINANGTSGSELGGVPFGAQ
jgi:subtilisin family serine protease